MLKFLRKNFSIIAPVDGRVIDLEKVEDGVFSKKVAGEGVAIEPTGDIVVAPADGRLSLLFNTNHAFGMILDNGVEILVHIGIDTVGLDSHGFKPLVKEGDLLKAGDPVIKIDRNFILSKGYSLITPIIITNSQDVREITCNTNVDVKAAEDVILTYIL
ncbi:Glucose-specific phosphotransferase enzyme IIA component [Clostridium liquoris]|uniref:Glucose-specific phosphotransferase enzyme IIA component n=1 Tax=Clostridium liquoris TaxID=1289519 RepID=A0A2T0BAA1_9CLOT|nr:PTS glucose transporter subunit IIA [Clostridium liquoris]PRR80819.1 Glucose-specific phosphotransferase enzyme IIA component [Clostridium liquoris]